MRNDVVLSHSSISALLAGVHSNGSATGRTGTTVRGGQEHESIETAVCAKPPAFRLPCLSVDLVGGCWVTGGLRCTVWWEVGGYNPEVHHCFS